MKGIGRDMAGRETVVSVRSVGVGYEAPLLEDVSFVVKAGEVFAILGGSGCGKSTLMKHIIGLAPPLSGEIAVLGDNTNSSSSRERARALRHFGVAYQSGALFGSMTLLENVSLPLESFTNLPRPARELTALLKLDQVGLQEYAAYLPSEISGGMRKRAAIARAMALDPAVLFLDEPSAGLDPITAAGLDQLILRLRDERKMTVVVVTHELESVYTIADRCILLDRERRGILAEGAPAELRDQPQEKAVRDFFHPRAYH